MRSMIKLKKIILISNDEIKKKRLEKKYLIQHGSTWSTCHLWHKIRIRKSDLKKKDLAKKAKAK
jgi:hypothetical protein